MGYLINDEVAMQQKEDSVRSRLDADQNMEAALWMRSGAPSGGSTGADGQGGGAKLPAASGGSSDLDRSRGIRTGAGRPGGGSNTVLTFIVSECPYCGVPSALGRPALDLFHSLRS